MNVRTALLLLLASALINAALLLAYAVWIAPPRAPRLATLDVGELYRLKETQVAAVLMKGEATDEERISALKRAGAFGAEVTTLIQALPEECSCLILARGAVIGERQALPDLTPEVRRRLGL
ncbi:MAG: hypothetical protein IH604_00575 [Burkholderiales bacterium]|nr:hypothetical protein [Burkholderiales bacterium]